MEEKSFTATHTATHTATQILFGILVVAIMKLNKQVLRD